MTERRPINAAVLTVSDTRTPETDASGNRLAGLLGDIGALVVDRSIVTDDTEEIRTKLVELVEKDGIDLVLTTGGTGFAARDNASGNYVEDTNGNAFPRHCGYRRHHSDSQFARVSKGG
jgi:molybdopterin biosynthesis enzyme MoaB